MRRRNKYTDKTVQRTWIRKNIIMIKTVHLYRHVKHCLWGVVFLGLPGGCLSLPEPVRTDPQQVKERSEHWNIEMSFTRFSSSDDSVNEGCRLFNERVREIVGAWQQSLKRDAAALFESLEQDTVLARPDWECQLLVTDSVFMASSRYISLRLMAYTYVGGAHGRTSFQALNYDVKNRKFLEVPDLFDPAFQGKVDSSLQDHFRNPEGCFTEVPVLDEAAAVNFNPLDVCVTFEQYVLGPYVCGFAEITVPRMELKEAWKIK